MEDHDGVLLIEDTVDRSSTSAAGIVATQDDVAGVSSRTLPVFSVRLVSRLPSTSGAGTGYLPEIPSGPATEFRRLFDIAPGSPTPVNHALRQVVQQRSNDVIDLRR